MVNSVEHKNWTAVADEHIVAGDYILVDLRSDPPRARKMRQDDPDRLWEGVIASVALHGSEKGYVVDFPNPNRVNQFSTMPYMSDVNKPESVSIATHEEEPVITQEMLDNWVVIWKPILGLDHWRIVIELRDDMDNLRGQSKRDGNYPSGLIHISSTAHEGEWARLDDYEELVVHELLHFVGRDPRQAMRDATFLLDKPTRKIMWRRFEDANETFVETMARVLVALRHGRADLGIGTLPRG